MVAIIIGQCLGRMALGELIDYWGIHARSDLGDP